MLFLQNLAMRLQGSDLLKLGAAQHLLDPFELETQLPIKQDLLQRQELRLFVEPVAVAAIKRRFSSPSRRRSAASAR
jgi:hypothetical protein